MYSGLKILVVDDHDDIRHMLRRFLELELDEHAEIVDAATSADGLARFAECSADIVLVDYMMPEMTGVEFARVLRKEHGYTGQLFVYSSAGSLIPWAEATALGVEVIEKTSVLELIEKIREAAKI